MCACPSACAGTTGREVGTHSIRLELVLVVDLERRILLGLAQHAIADHEQLDLVAHEAGGTYFELG